MGLLDLNIQQMKASQERQKKPFQFFPQARLLQAMSPLLFLDF